MSDQSETNVVVERADGITTILFDRPAKKNALTRDMYGAAAAALAEAEADAAVRAIVLAGNGDAYCAGNDLGDFLSVPPDLHGETPVARFLATISTLETPLIAAVQGPAVGVGTTMLLHCDMVVADETARLQIPFVNLGVVPEAASSLLLPELVGHQRAFEIFVLGEPLDAPTAQSLGLVSRVVAAGKARATAQEIAARIAQRAPNAVKLTKRLLRSGRDRIAAQMEEESAHFAAQVRSAEAREAFSAFFEKRAPDFSKVA